MLNFKISMKSLKIPVWRLKLSLLSNVSIKNNVPTSISYVCSGQNILAKTIHHTVNVTSTKAKLFAIRYGINQTIHLQNFITVYHDLSRS